MKKWKFGRTDENEDEIADELDETSSNGKAPVGPALIWLVSAHIVRLALD